MSDEDYEENMTETQREAVRKLRKTVRVPSQTDLSIEVEVNDKEKEELRAELEDYKNKLTIIAQRRFNEKKARIGCRDPNIRTPEELRDWEENHGNVDPTRRTSSGTLSLAGQTGSGSGVEFADQKEMIEFLQRRKASGTLEEKREAKAVLDELWRKLLKGKAGKARNEGFDDLNDEGTPLLTKFHEEWKKRKDKR